MNEFTPLLYFSPGACSLAVHIALIESGIPHRIAKRSTDAGETRTPAFLKINPLGKVPVLEIAPANHLTEVAAIMTWIDANAAQPMLPRDAEQRVRAYEWLSLLGTTAHPAFARLNRPERFTDVERAIEGIRERAVRTYLEVLALADRRLVEPFAMGDTFTAIDAYLFVFLTWARYRQLDLSDLPKLRAWGARMLDRPSVRSAIDREGLTAAFGLAA